MLSLTFQVSIPESSSSSSSGSSQSSKSECTTVECSSINSGISLANSYISKQINLSHCKVIVFSSELASKGLNDYIDTLSNNIEIRPNCNVIISRGTAKKFIEEAEPSIETLTARYYEVALKSSDYTGYTTSTQFATFVNDVKNSFVEATAILGGVNMGDNKPKEPFDIGIDGNYIAGDTPIKSGDKKTESSNSSGGNSSSGDSSSNDSQESSDNSSENKSSTSINNSTASSDNSTNEQSANNMETFGTAVFHRDKFVGELTGFETLCFLLITDNIKNCIISVPNPLTQSSSNFNQIDLSVTESKKPKIKVEFLDSKPVINVELFLDAHGLTLNDSIDYTSMSDVEELEKSANQYLERKISDFLYKTSKEYNSDIVGFGKYVLSKYITWDEWEKSNWSENYKNASFNVDVNLIVISGAEFDKSP